MRSERMVIHQSDRASCTCACPYLQWLNRKTMREAAHRAWAMLSLGSILIVRDRNIAYCRRNRNNHFAFFFCEIFPRFSNFG